MLDRLLNEYAAAAIDYHVKNREPTPEKELEVAFHRLLSARVAIEEYVEPAAPSGCPSCTPARPRAAEQSS